MRYGYVRVSTKEQNIYRQMSALALENILQNQIFIDRASEKILIERNTKKLPTVLQADDEIVIKSIDRLGRNYDDILEQWQFLTKTKSAYQRFRFSTSTSTESSSSSSEMKKMDYSLYNEVREKYSQPRCIFLEICSKSYIRRNNTFTRN
ncbi:recombinase family protein [Streptococcus sp. IsoGale021]|uniref:recombinase family protein n=1 Tax=Streptococcus TaxID=1301 RepID=UPI0020014070|nr:MULTISPECIES: recombinase family protein [Streptococcus]MCY7210063.1 recombinase family protein [Streptococcus anginosus]MCY7211803.1 recombinase family protein [Streptococcus anginosus]MCY7226907.1 recombinase family protein [Streptococcus anginosus]MDQ8694978.1 recombinase family protein [Streptococcus sp. IsoGale021]MDU5129175.1 recombinase family protein [Streptococcus anginosus]